MKFCPSCGTPRVSAFCGNCGFRFPEATSDAPSTDQNDVKKTLAKSAVARPGATENIAKRGVKSEKVSQPAEGLTYGPSFDPSKHCANCGQRVTRSGCKTCDE